MDDVTLRELPDQTALTVHRRLAMEALGQGIGEALAAIAAHMEACGAECTGPPFCLYPGEMAEELDVVVAMPVPADTPAGEGVGLETVPGGACAEVTHRGPYSTIGDAYAAVQAWMAANGKAPAGPPREAYLNDPMVVPAADLLTRIDWPVA